MIRAGSACSTAADASRAAEGATRAALAEAGLSRANCAICFATTAQGAGFPAIMRTVAETAGTREVAGCSASGVITTDDDVEKAVAVAVLVVGGDAIAARRMFVPGLRGRAREAAHELAAAARPIGNRGNLLCVFADSYNAQGDLLLRALQAELPGITIVGGGATEDGSIGETFQFCGDTVSSNSLSAILLSGDFDLNIGATLACSPLGPGHRVTAVEDNVLIKLDGRPAFEVFKEAIGPLADDLQRAVSFVFLGVPIDPEARSLQRGGYFIRNIVGFNQENGLLAVAHQPRVGDLVGLVLRNGERARDDLKATLGEMKGRIHRNPAFALYFDCVSRGEALYGIRGHDTAYIQQHLGRIPLIGFRTGFEIGPLGAGTGLLQYSGVLALVSEKPS